MTILARQRPGPRPERPLSEANKTGSKETGT